MRWLPIAVLVLGLAVGAWVVLGITRDDGRAPTGTEPTVSRAAPLGESAGFVPPDDVRAQLPDVSADASVVDIPIAAAPADAPEWAPTGRLVGRVVTSKGEALGSATVDAFAFETSGKTLPFLPGRRRTQASMLMALVADMGPPDASTTADVDGRFELRRLPAGKPLGLRVAGASGQVLLRDDMAALAGETLDLGDVVVPDGAAVYGQVSDASGRELSDVEVILANGIEFVGEVRRRRGCDSSPAIGRSSPRVARTAADGTFRFENVGAQYTQIAVFAAGFAMWSKRLTLEPGERSVQDVTLQPGLRITGKTVDEQGHPVAGAEVTVKPKGSHPFYLACARSDDHGRFELVDVSADEHSLSAVVRGVMSCEEFVVEAGAKDVVLPLRPLTGYGTLTVDVIDSTGGPAAGFKLWCAMADTAFPLGWGEARPGGQVRLNPWRTALPTSVWAEAHGCISAAVSLPIGDSAEPHIRLQLQPAVPVQGRVVDAVTHAAIPAAELHIQILNDVQLTDDPTWADADGRFRIENVPPGEVSIDVRAAGHRTTTTRIGAAQARDVEVKLEPAGTLIVDASAAWRRDFGARASVSVTENGGGRVMSHMGSELPCIATPLDPGQYNVLIQLSDPGLPEPIKLIHVDVAATGVTRVDLSSVTFSQAGAR